MSRRVQKLASILMALILAFAPLEGIYASSEHHCDNPETAAIQAHQHSDETLDIHSAEEAQNQNCKCVVCAGNECCCNSSSCSCSALTSMFIQANSDFDLIHNFTSSSIPFTHFHLAKHDVPPLLRPPIA